MYYGLMDTNATFPANSSGGEQEIIVIFDPELALLKFVTEPLAAALGKRRAEVEAEYDLELIFGNSAFYDSVNGREGYRLREDYNVERLLELAERSPAYED
jgi:hypothetical protein